MLHYASLTVDKRLRSDQTMKFVDSVWQEDQLNECQDGCILLRIAVNWGGILDNCVSSDDCQNLHAGALHLPGSQNHSALSDRSQHRVEH